MSYVKKFQLAIKESTKDSSKLIADYLILKANPLVPNDTGLAVSTAHVSQYSSEGFEITYNPRANGKSYGEFIYDMRNGRRPRKAGTSDTFMDDLLNQDTIVNNIKEIVSKQIKQQLGGIK